MLHLDPTIVKKFFYYCTEFTFPHRLQYGPEMNQSDYGEEAMNKFHFYLFSDACKWLQVSIFPC